MKGVKATEKSERGNKEKSERKTDSKKSIHFRRMSETALYTTISVVENCPSCAFRLPLVLPPPVCLQ